MVDLVCGVGLPALLVRNPSSALFSVFRVFAVVLNYILPLQLPLPATLAANVIA